MISTKRRSKKAHWAWDSWGLSEAPLQALLGELATYLDKTPNPDLRAVDELVVAFHRAQLDLSLARAEYTRDNLQGWYLDDYYGHWLRQDINLEESYQAYERVEAQYPEVFAALERAYQK